MIWTGLIFVLIVPLVAASFSPLLAWRSPIYIASGFAGIAGLIILVLQPLLAARLLPNLSHRTADRWHRWLGAALVASVVLHVAGLWLTSPPDVIDVLLFRSPTPFSIWGVLAMWAVFVSALVMALRRPMRLKPAVWRTIHRATALVIVLGTAMHALLIEGTMEQMSKIALCALAACATSYALFLRVRS